MRAPVRNTTALMVTMALTKKYWNICNSVGKEFGTMTRETVFIQLSPIKELQYFEKFEEIFVLSLLVFLTNVAAKLIFDALTGYVQTHHGQGLLTRLKTFFQSATTRKANQSI